MQKREHTMSYTEAEIDDMLRRGESQTDWARVDAMTEEELDASIDPDDEGDFDWTTVHIGIPGPKRQLTVRFDADVIDWFKEQGPGYQTRMNAVLRGYVDAQKK